MNVVFFPPWDILEKVENSYLGVGDMSKVSRSVQKVCREVYEANTDRRYKVERVASNITFNHSLVVHPLLSR